VVDQCIGIDLLQCLYRCEAVKSAPHVEGGDDLAALGVEVAIRRIAVRDVAPIAAAARWPDF
jgi:hypothetical protein